MTHYFQVVHPLEHVLDLFGRNNSCVVRSPGSVRKEPDRSQLGRSRRDNSALGVSRFQTSAIMPSSSGQFTPISASYCDPTKSARGLAHSKTLREDGSCTNRRQALECGSPLPLFHGPLTQANYGR